MYAIYGNIYHQYTPNVSIYSIHGSYGYGNPWEDHGTEDDFLFLRETHQLGEAGNTLRSTYIAIENGPC